MLILVIIVVVAVLGIIFAKQIDQRRWQRYQFERDIYFRQYPFQWKGLEQFELVLNINAQVQKKLINQLMLRPSNDSYIRKSSIQREPEYPRQHYTIKVMVQDFTIGYLETKYAELFGASLDQTDFEIGRPIELNAEIIVFERDNGVSCRVKLDLPRNPKTAYQYLIENNQQQFKEKN